MQDFRVPLYINILAMIIRGYSLSYLYTSRHSHSKKTLYLRRILSVGVASSMLIDSAWIMVLLNDLSMVDLPSVLLWGWVRLSWLCTFVYAQTIAMFILYITQKEIRLRYRDYLLFVPSILICVVYTVYSLIYCQSRCVASFEQYLRLAGVLSGIFLLVLPSIWYSGRVIRSSTFPRILRLQILWAMAMFVVPFVITEFFGLLSSNYVIEESTYALIYAVTTLFLSVGMYLIGRRLLRLRFLNLQKRVTAAPRANFVTEMEKAADELHSVTDLSELHHIARSFFERSFSVAPKTVHFYLQSDELDLKLKPSDFEKLNDLRSFFTTKDQKSIELVKHQKVLILDELVFSTFYEHDPLQEQCVTLLKKLDADILLPIFKGGTIIAYIVVDKDARPNQLYTNAESNEMTVFAAGIGNVVNILQNKNFELAAEREFTLKQELETTIRTLERTLHDKTQENSQYKEGLRTFLYNEKQRNIGVFFYKNKRFVPANRAAKNIIPINLNLCPGDPLTKTLTSLARSVEQYRDSHSRLITNSEGKRFVVSAVPSIEKNVVNTVIIIISPPEVSDLIKKQIDLLKDPQAWDYLLYLKTTKVGRLVNEALPGLSKSVINFKIELLKAAFCSQASLITAASQDIESLVALLHQISMRDSLYTLKLYKESDNTQTAIELFGASTLISSKDVEYKQPLLKRLDKNGTLHIENIENLTLDTQKQLADYILYGYFNPVSSKKTIVSDVRILCSTNQNLQALVQQGLFDARLCKMLEKSSVSMPSLAALDGNEFKEIIENITSEALNGTTFSELITLSEHEKIRITKDRPASFAQLQSKVTAILTRKSKDKNISYGSNLEEVDMDDPIVSQAIQLGKKALVNKVLMAALWNKFKNYAKIADLIGVNRSSVQRRCREYGFGNDQSTDSSTPDSSTPPSSTDPS